MHFLPKLGLAQRKMTVHHRLPHSCQNDQLYYKLPRALEWPSDQFELDQVLSKSNKVERILLRAKTPNMPFGVLAPSSSERLVVPGDPYKHPIKDYICIAALCRSQLYDLILRENQETQQGLIIFFKGADPSKICELEQNRLCSIQAAVWVNGSDFFKIAAGSYKVRYMNEKYFEKIEIQEAKIKRLQEKKRERKEEKRIQELQLQETEKMYSELENKYYDLECSLK